MKPVILAILDGWGHSAKHTGNPILEAKKPTFDMLDARFPKTLLQASGLAVGMNFGEVGNSEVGHMNLGAGRLVQQYQHRIQQSIQDTSFYQNVAIKTAFDHAKEHSGTIHIIGLLTSGTVHADLKHLLALLDFAKKINFKKIALHLFTDGRDSGLKEGASLIEKVGANIATVVGRGFAMDREKHLDLTAIAHDAIASGKGERVKDFGMKLRECYANNIMDPNIPPLIAEGYEGVQAGDAMFFFNFREDSMRQIYASFQEVGARNVYISSMTDYLHASKLAVAFYPPNIKNNLSETISAAGMRQLHIAETDKYAHVTYFFNGLREEPIPLEDDEFIPSVEKLEEHPEMRAKEIADRIITEIAASTYGLIIANLANADLLAHTGNYDATLKGVEAIETAMGRIVESVMAHDATLIITADHGNAESLVYASTGEAESKHNDSPVPMYLIGTEFKAKSEKRKANDVSGILGDVAPTILEIMGINQPEEMTGKSLLPELLGRNR